MDLPIAPTMQQDVSKKQERIVIIDDSMNDVQLVQRLLARAGYQVHYANSGEEGLRLAAEIVPDCVMVDYRMPGLDGYEVSRRLKSDPVLHSIPVLMLTGADSAKNVIEGLDAGADDFVTKSSDLDVILARVRALLRVKAYQDRIVEQSEQLRRLYEEIKDKSDRIMALNQRFNRDLQIARRVQEALLPVREFQAEGITIRGSYIPSETLSGDFYDYFVDRGKLYVLMADVSGHGLPAAILVSLLKTFLRSEVTEAASPAIFMSRLNDYLYGASLPAQFATAQLIVIDCAKRELVVSNGAHPPFLLYRKTTRSTSMSEFPGNLVGARPDVHFEEVRFSVSPGDVLFMYTDGLTDRRTSAGEFFPIERVMQILDEYGGEATETIHERIYDLVTSFAATDEFKDDIAFIVTKFEA